MSLEERHRPVMMEDGWTSYVGRTITMREVETEGESKRRRDDEIDPNMNTKSWHTLSSRPEPLFMAPIPRLAMNAYMQRLVQDFSRMFNPMSFALHPEGMAAIRRRDR
jgi:hypothetical protein